MILGVEDVEDLLEIAAEKQDKELQKALKESARQYSRGEISSLDVLWAIYRGCRTS